LTVMIGVASLVKMNLPETHPCQSDLDRVIDAGEQAAHLAGQLLTFSRQRSRGQHSVDLNEAVRQTVRLLRGALPRSIQVESDLAAGALPVWGEETQLKQVIMNLCLNARDAMPTGGRLLLRTGRLPQHGTSNGQEDVLFRVEDTGLGMDDEVQSHIFEPFYSTKEHGTGLGLAVVQQIVSEMGGVIKVWSKPREGTRMEIRFKSSRPAPVLEEQPA